MVRYDYDLVVIGGGAAGLVASSFGAGIGKKTLLVEKDRLGGECTWSGCVPSKALIRAAHAVHDAEGLSRFGVKASVDIDASNVLDHVRSIVQLVYETETPDIFRARGMDVKIGSFSFTGPHAFTVDGESITGKKFVIATGSRAFIPLVEGLDSVDYLTNETVFLQKRLPRSMIVLGGGPIGIELAQAFHRLGVEITVVHNKPNILPRDDEELTGLLADSLARGGLSIMCGASAVSAEKKGDGVALTVHAADGEKVIEAEALLVSAGRQPNIDGLGLEYAGVDSDAGGIVADSAMRTTAKHIFTAGDVTGPYRFTHAAELTAVTAARNALLPFYSRVDYSNMAWCTFTDPELANAGMTEQEARKRHGDGIRVYRWGFDEIDRARTDLDAEGMVKIITDRKMNILGAHILGARAGEMIHELQLARRFKLPLHRLRTAVHIYPTLMDGIKQPSKKAAVDKLMDHPVVRLIRKLRGS